MSYPTPGPIIPPNGLRFSLHLGPAQIARLFVQAHTVRHANDTIAEILILHDEAPQSSPPTLLGFLSCFCDIISGEPEAWRVVDVDGGDIPGIDRFYNSPYAALDAAHDFVFHYFNWISRGIDPLDHADYYYWRKTKRPVEDSQNKP